MTIGTKDAVFDRVDSPGLYLERRTRTLFRVPVDAVSLNVDGIIQAASGEAEGVTRLSLDPYLTLAEARKLIAELEANF